MISTSHFRMLSLLICTLMSYVCNGQTTVLINSTKKNIEVGKHFTFIEDKTNTLNINDVIKSRDFNSQVNSDIPNFGVSKSSFWIKVILKNLTNQKDFL